MRNNNRKLMVTIGVCNMWEMVTQRLFCYLFSFLLWSTNSRLLLPNYIYTDVFYKILKNGRSRASAVSSLVALITALGTFSSYLFNKTPCPITIVSDPKYGNTWWPIWETKLGTPMSLPNRIACWCALNTKFRNQALSRKHETLDINKHL